LANRDLAIGLNITQDALGITENTTASGSFAYRIPTKNGRLAMGIQAQANLFQMDLTTAVSAVADDPSLSQNVNKMMFNAGAGIYYYTKNFYIGASIPRLIKNSHRSVEVGKDPFTSQTRHYYAMAGYVFELSNNVKLRPTALVKYVKNAPVQADFGAAFLLNETIWIGGQYRTGRAMDAHIEYQVNQTMRIGYSFGHQFGQVGANSLGSHEVLIGIDIPTNGSKKAKKGSIRCYF
jgi:type IX secretion system PorP/SprF family membrane protein